MSAQVEDFTPATATGGASMSARSDRRGCSGYASGSRRSIANPCLRQRMIRIAITAEAFEAIARTPSHSGSVRASREVVGQW